MRKRLERSYVFVSLEFIFYLLETYIYLYTNICVCALFTRLNYLQTKKNVV